MPAKDKCRVYRSTDNGEKCVVVEHIETGFQASKKER